MVSRTRPEPLYHQVLEELRRRVSAGIWRPGARIPSERELAELLDVSRITIRHAMDLASAEGLLVQTRGVGTFVADPGKMEQDLAEVRTFEESLATLGHVASTEILLDEVAMSDLAVARTLQLDAAASVCHLQLLGLGNSSAVVFYDSYFPLDVGREVVAVAQSLQTAGRPFSSLDLYGNEDVQAAPTTLSQTIEAVGADNAVADRLCLLEGAPVLAIESLIADEFRPVEFRRAYYRGDRYKFAIDRRLRS